ncbi:MAG: hypothetical protein RIQ81_913 [Pseudomonadota bacterium]|jgi:hypothetical protein
MTFENSPAIDRLGTHESGHGMIEFTSFPADDVSLNTIQQLCKRTAAEFGQGWDWVRINLDQRQFAYRDPLEKIGFQLDGWEYGIPIKQLKNSLKAANHAIPGFFSIAPMDYERDIDAVMEMEISVHAADPSTRVSLDNPAALQGARAYYQRTSGEGGVYLMWRDNKLSGLVGLRADKKRADAVHISSVAIALELQGRGLFFPMVMTTLAQSKFSKRKILTGVTTTTKLIHAAEKHGAALLGVSMSINRAKLGISEEIPDPSSLPD